MVGGEDCHTRIRVLPSHIGQRQERSGTGVAAGGLSNQLSLWHVSWSYPTTLYMGLGHDDNLAFGRPEQVGAIQGALEHRAGPDEGAILFRLFAVEEPLYE